MKKNYGRCGCEHNCLTFAKQTTSNFTKFRWCFGQLWFLTFGLPIFAHHTHQEQPLVSFARGVDRDMTWGTPYQGLQRATLSCILSWPFWIQGWEVNAVRAHFSIAEISLEMFFSGQHSCLPVCKMHRSSGVLCWQSWSDRFLFGFSQAFWLQNAKQIPCRDRLK